MKKFFRKSEFLAPLVIVLGLTGFGIGILRAYIFLKYNQ